MKTTTTAIVLSVCAGICTSTAWAQSPRPPLVGGYVTAGVGIANPPVSNPTSVATDTDGLNTDQATTTFELPGARTFEFGGGVTFLGALTVGAAFEDSFSEQAGMVDLSLTHPLAHPVLRTSTTTGPLQHSEKATHIEIGYKFPRTGPFAIRVFGGPTHVSLRQEAVSRLAYDETFNPATRTFTPSITNLETEAVKASAWGYHAGVDGSYFFSKHVGVGGLLRYSRATVDLENPLQSLVDDRTATDPFKVGGLRVTGGVRVRF
jgi:hypothetical protein